MPGMHADDARPAARMATVERDDAKGRQRRPSCIVAVLVAARTDVDVGAVARRTDDAALLERPRVRGASRASEPT